MIRVRYLPEYNYASLFDPNGQQTYRLRIDGEKPIEKLPWHLSEHLDIAINNKCAGGCDYCYINALPSGKNYSNIVDKAKLLFDSEDFEPEGDIVNEMANAIFGTDRHIDFGLRAVQTTKPYQIAIGGAGEPTMHPNFVDFLKAVYDMDIMPNFTTNGMKVNSKILQAVNDYVGGVSVSIHDHLEAYWKKAVKKYSETNAKVHVHLIVYDKSSIKRIGDLLEEFEDITIVLLPFQYVGFGADYERKTTEFYDDLFNSIVFNGWKERIAYGANFHNYLKRNNIVNASLYEPHNYSSYIDLSGNGSVYTTSFDWKNPIEENVFGESYEDN